MTHRNSMLALNLIFCLCTFVLCLLRPAATTTVTLGRCALFAVQAGTAVSANGAQTTITTGSVGVAPGSAITGDLVLSSGALEDNSQAAINCAADELVAYAQLKAATCATTTSTDLSGLTLTPGVYCSAAGTFAISASTVTLNGQGDVNSQWIFQAATTLTTATATSFILHNGANAANVFWQIGSSATLGGTSSFVGTILAYASITVGTNTQIVGRTFAQAAVTFAGGDSITLPTPTTTTNTGTTTQSDNSPSSSSSGLSTTAEVCAIVFSILGFFLIIGVMYFIVQRNFKGAMRSTAEKEKISLPGVSDIPIV